MKKIGLAAVCLTFSVAASADGLAISANASTLGLGLNLSKGFSS